MASIVIEHVAAQAKLGSCCEEEGGDEDWMSNWWDLLYYRVSGKEAVCRI